MLMSVFVICAIGDVPSPRTTLAAMTFAGFALNVWALGTLFDLVCTLFHRDLGNLYELNPLAVPLMTHASTVVAFKLSLTIGAAIGFLVARSCRLAQVGCWWVVVAYTILILRWNSYY
jgi:hypothetical protein